MNQITNVVVYFIYLFLTSKVQLKNVDYYLQAFETAY